jgi:hypothetical protein
MGWAQVYIDILLSSLRVRILMKQFLCHRDDHAIYVFYDILDLGFRKYLDIYEFGESIYSQPVFAAATTKSIGLSLSFAHCGNSLRCSSVDSTKSTRVKPFLRSRKIYVCAVRWVLPHPVDRQPNS